MKGVSKSYGRTNTDISRLSHSNSLLTSQITDSSTDKAIRFETFVTQCRNTAPHLSKHPKARQITTEYISRSNTVGREQKDNPFLFDDYFSMFLDKHHEEIPEIREVKIYHNFEKILGIHCVFEVGNEKIRAPVYVGTDADLGYEEATLTVDKGDSIVELSGFADKCVHRLRLRTFYGQVVEAGGHAGKPFKSLFKPNQKLLFIGGSATEQIDSLYAYY